MFLPKFLNFLTAPRNESNMHSIYSFISLVTAYFHVTELVDIILLYCKIWLDYC